MLQKSMLLNRIIGGDQPFQFCSLSSRKLVEQLLPIGIKQLNGSGKQFRDGFRHPSTFLVAVVGC